MEWKKKNTLGNGIVNELQKAVEQLVIQQVSDIHSKLESLCQMGVIPDNAKIQLIRQQMKDLKETSQKQKD
jgi:hypothetical protein